MLSDSPVAQIEQVLRSQETGTVPTLRPSHKPTGS
jgi:hypothetical protein